MKRSEINQIIRDAFTFIKEQNFALPPFVTWTYDEWKTKNSEYDEIKDCMLGWDITDFGKGNFRRTTAMITLQERQFRRSSTTRLMRKSF